MKKMTYKNCLRTLILHATQTVSSWRPQWHLPKILWKWHWTTMFVVSQEAHWRLSQAAHQNYLQEDDQLHPKPVKWKYEDLISTLKKNLYQMLGGQFCKIVYWNQR